LCPLPFLTCSFSCPWRDSNSRLAAYRKLISEHGFDKLRLIDCTFAEFDAAIAAAEVIEERDIATGVKELLLVVEWRRPLHVVVVVDDSRREERILTVYEPDPQRWTADYRRRR
jgi:hypothetical protein